MPLAGAWFMWKKTAFCFSHSNMQNGAGNYGTKIIRAILAGDRLPHADLKSPMLTWVLFSCEHSKARAFYKLEWPWHPPSHNEHCRNWRLCFLPRNNCIFMRCVKILKFWRRQLAWNSSDCSFQRRSAAACNKNLPESRMYAYSYEVSCFLDVSLIHMCTDSSLK